MTRPTSATRPRPASLSWRTSTRATPTPAAPTARDQLYKIGLPGKSILGDYFQENRTFLRHFLLLRIRFPGRPILIQLPTEAGVQGRLQLLLPPRLHQLGAQLRARVRGQQVNVIINSAIIHEFIQGDPSPRGPGLG